MRTAVNREEITHQAYARIGGDAQSRHVDGQSSRWNASIKPTATQCSMR